MEGISKKGSQITRATHYITSGQDPPGFTRKIVSDLIGILFLEVLHLFAKCTLVIFLVKFTIRPQETQSLTSHLPKDLQ